MPPETPRETEPARRSYRLGKRRDAIDRTRQRILEAATELFSGPAPARISLDDVASRAGVSRATVYYQFKSRSELLDAVVLAAIPVARFAELVAAREQPDALESARLYVGGMADFWAACGPVIVNVSALAVTDPEARLLADTYDESRRQALIALADRLESQGYLREGVSAAYAADVMWWLTSIPAFSHLHTHSGLSLEVVGNTLVAMLAPLLRQDLAP